MSGIYMVYTRHILKIGVPDDSTLPASFATVQSTSMFYFKFPRAFCTDQYIQVCTKDVQVHTHQEAVHTSFQSGMISLTSLLQLEGNIMGISKFLDALRIWWNNRYSILRKSSTTVLLYHFWYALVHTQYRPCMY